MKSKVLPFVVALCALTLFSCGKKSTDPTPDEPVAPTAITLSTASIAAPQAGGSYTLTVKAPARPKLSGLPEWMSYTDGTFSNYQISFTLVVEENESYETRSASITVSASGAASVTLAVSQEAAEEPEPPTPPTPGSGIAWEMSEALGLGWNMGNHFDAYYNGSWAGEKEGYPDETAWQPNKATQITFDGVKNAGFTSVRIPISWLKMIGEAPDYTIREDWMNRVYEVVQFAHNAGLTVIINTHHDENHGVNNDYQWLDIKNAANNSALNESIKAKIKAVWTQIAQKFADCGDWLIMEGFNELNDGGWGWSAEFRADPTKQCNILNEWNQVFVDAVRATGGNNATRWLGVPTYAANPAYEQYLTLPTDPAGKLMISVHYYDPSEYTIGEAQYSDWGHTGASGKKATWGDEDHVQEVFGNLMEKYVENDIPVYVGEFGCSMRDKSNTRAWSFYLYYMEYIVKAARTYGMPCFLWDNGAEGYGQEKHGYINHGTGAYLGNAKDVVDVMKKARFTDDASYTLQSVYDSAPRF